MPSEYTADFFVLRTPLLPFEDVLAWSRELEAASVGAATDRASALARDRQRLRQRMERVLERPEIQEALFLASPSLEAGLDAWRRDPESKKGQRAEQALVRYFLRMASRATPFGLFAGCSLGTVGAQTRLELAARRSYGRHTRLDMDYLYALDEALERDRSIREHLRYVPNSSLYEAAGRLRYVESRVLGRGRAHHLVAVEADGYLRRLLDRAAGGARLEALATDLAEDEEVELEEAREFVDELVDHQILVSDLAPPVTGEEPIHHLRRKLVEIPSAGAIRDRLDAVQERLEALDSAGLGNRAEAYRDVATKLEELPVDVELARLFQVDLVKPAEAAVLGREVEAELLRGVEILHRLGGRHADSPLDSFRKAFRSRYEGRDEVPLTEALDGEIGIGFEKGGGASTSPLLAGLPIVPRGAVGVPTTPWGPRERLMLDKLLRSREDGATAIEIEDQDLDDFPDTELPPLPAAFHVMATLAAPTEEALANGSFRLLFRQASGPSGAKLLGRFCHGDPCLRLRVEEHLAAEEAQDPEAIYAEVVHLPQGRLGNVLLRPVMRSHEIPFLARAGVGSEHQISLDDLTVSLRGSRIELRSRRLGRRVVPRLTSAHNFQSNALGAYRFFGLLQTQDLAAGLAWRWGILDDRAYLPRVTCGRLVFERARWRVKRSELGGLEDKSSAERFDAVQEWRERRKLPRFVELVDGDNELLIDLDNVLSIEAFLAVTRKRSSFLLTERFPGPTEEVVRGPEGSFHHELVVPFVRRRAADAEATPSAGSSAVAPASGGPAVPAGQRSFLPGSEWLYVKLYSGPGIADQLLQHLAPWIERRMADAEIDRWFFLRYGDPDRHLRLRLHGDPAKLGGAVLPALHRWAEPLLGRAFLWRLQVDSYERELNRYGGGLGMDLAEKLFHADSEAVLEMVQHYSDDESGEARWLLTARGIDRMLTDLGFDPEEAARILAELQDGFAAEFDSGPLVKKRLARRLREKRSLLEGCLESVYDAETPLAAGFRALERRSQALEPIVAELRRAAAAGRLSLPLTELAKSYVHMFTNRLLRDEGRAHEFVLYDFLARHHRSRLARSRQAGSRRDQPSAPVADRRRRAGGM